MNISDYREYNLKKRNDKVDVEGKRTENVSNDLFANVKKWAGR